MHTRTKLFHFLTELLFPSLSQLRNARATCVEWTDASYGGSYTGDNVGGRWRKDIGVKICKFGVKSMYLSGNRRIKETKLYSKSIALIYIFPFPVCFEIFVPSCSCFKWHSCMYCLPVIGGKIWYLLSNLSVKPLTNIIHWELFTFLM